MMNVQIKSADLLLNSDGSIYHLRLHPHEVAETIILVGDPGRVALISSFFDTIEHERVNREFVTHTGTFAGKRFTVISTGIGIGNIDIVLNELDALVNIDFTILLPKDALRSLRIVRIGTSGAMRADIEPGSAVLSRYCMGLDNILDFYIQEPLLDEAELKQALRTALPDRLHFYVSAADPGLFTYLAPHFIPGITIVAPGFFGPQTRKLRLSAAYPNMFEHLEEFSWNGLHVTNLEMEASAVFGLGRLLGHRCGCVDLILANRITQTYLTSYQDRMAQLCKQILELLAQA